MKKKGGFGGSSQTKRDETTDVKNIGSEITTGGDLTLVSGGDQRYQGAKLNSGKDLTLDSGGSIAFEAVKDLHQESHEKSKGDLAWNSASGKGATDETLRQSTLEHQGELAIKAADGLKIDIKQIDQKSVSETIDSMVQADPSLAWLKDAEARGDVDWQLVKELHDSFKYSNSGLGVGAQLAIAIVMAAFVGPAAMGALGGTGAVAAGGAAIATGAATNASISLINNKGNLGDVIKDVTSSDALKGYAIAGITAGLTAGYFDDLTGTTTDINTGKITTNLSTWKGIGQFAAKQGLQNGTSAALGKIMGQGGDLGDALQSTLFNTLAAASFNAVGGYTKGALDDGSLGKIAIHAMVGGLLSQVSGGDFRTGALAAGANEAMVDQLNTWVGGNKDLLNMSSQLVGMLAAATQSGADAESLEKGAWVAENATQYNHDNHHLSPIEEVDRDLRKEMGENVSPAEREALGDESLHIGLPPPGVSGILGGGPKAPQSVEKISNSPQAPVIPLGWESRPGRNGGEIYFPSGTDPAKGEHIRVMPPGSSPVPGYENGYWRWQNSGKQPMNPATGKPGVGQGDTHVPLPPDALPPVRR